MKWYRVIILTWAGGVNSRIASFIEWTMRSLKSSVDSGMPRADLASSPENDLIDRLIGHDICYFDGNGREPNQPIAPLTPLLRDLARTSNSRLRSALIALLVRHPEHAPTAETVAHDLPSDDPTSRPLLLSILIAAALQSEWSFTLDL